MQKSSELLGKSATELRALIGNKTALSGGVAGRLYRAD